MELDIDLGSLQATLLAGVRMAAFMIIAPPFSHRAIPSQVRAILAVCLGMAVSAGAAPGFVPVGTATLLGYVVAEAVMGAMLGALVMIVMSAITAAGSHLDLFGGFSLAMAYDPQTNVQGSQLTRLFALTAVVLMFTSNAYQMVVLGLARSYEAVPVGALAGVPVDSFVEALTGSFVAGLQIAGPIIVVLFLADVGLGLVNRVAPALNAFAMGFPLKIFLTLSLVGTVVVALPHAVAVLVDQALGYMGEVG
ncbi:flagellar biosynthetic protein FliR [Isoptericola rhizosphaerae]|uniref:flagellar biosynthetic protein FliR n=1 Tax=Isoptericola rhizosphaerae TaxID=3377837 RepID=UPI00383AA057